MVLLNDRNFFLLTINGVKKGGGVIAVIIFNCITLDSMEARDLMDLPYNSVHFGDCVLH